jgi:hypothetical protein
MSEPQPQNPLWERAGSLPQDFVLTPDVVNTRNLVGASLLAIAVVQLVVMLAVLASSRAGSLPQDFVSTPDVVKTRNLVGASLLAIAVGQLVVMLAVPMSSRASSLPQGKRGPTKSQVGCQAASRWTLISAPR